MRMSRLNRLFYRLLRSNEYLRIVFINLFFLVLIILMLPLRNVGYEDDFSYYHTVGHFFSTGSLVVNEWIAPSFLAQAWWGYLFSHILGFSYPTLHVAVIVLSWIALNVMYLLIKEITHDNKKAFFFTAILFSYPAVLRYIFSFMTDIPYLTMLILGLYLGVLSLTRNSWKYALGASIFGSLAFLVRNLGISVPISLVLTLVIQAIWQRRFPFSKLLAAALPAGIVYIVYSQWIHADGHMTVSQVQQVYGRLETMKEIFLPTIVYINQTNNLYKESFHRMALFTSILMGFLTPAVLSYSFPAFRTDIRHILKKNRIGFFIGFLIPLLLYMQLVKDYGFMLEGIYHLSFLPVASPNSWGAIIYASIRANPFLLALFFIFSFVLLFVFSSISGIFMQTVARKLAVKTSAKKLFTFLALFLVVTVFILFFTQESLDEAIRIYLYKAPLVGAFWGIVLFLLLFLLFFRPKIQPFSKRDFVFLFLVCVGAFHAFFTVITHNMRFEYIFPFFPIALVLLDAVFYKRPLHVVRAGVILIVISIIAISFTRKDYQLVGMMWEDAASRVKTGQIEAKNVKFPAFAWKPFYYLEVSMQKDLKRYGGDKRKVSLHSWWKPEYDPDLGKVVVTYEECNATEKKQQGVRVVRREKQDIFEKFVYCTLWQHE
ncbi:MAG: glycosyltransferase family 39 protein [bacterium]|nr:glycosyltransferase family 39 protein [bacterium]